MSGSSEAAGTSKLGWAALAALILGYLLMVLVAGVPGSPLVPVLPAGVHPARWIARGAEWLSLSDLTRTQLTGLSLGLVAGVLVAFGVLLREAWGGRVGLPVVMAGAGIAIGLAVAAPVLLSRDLYSYAAYGRILAVHGSNPYLQPPSAFPGDPFVAVASPEWIHTRSVYGPVFTLLSAGIARAWSGSPGGTILAFKAMAGAAGVGAALLAAMAARTVRPRRAAAAMVAIGLNPVLLMHTVGGGHNDALIALCFAGGFLLAIRAARADDGPRGARAGSTLSVEGLLATLLLTVAVLIKAVVAPLLVLWLWQVWRAGASGRTGRLARLVAHAGVVTGATIAAFIPVRAGWSTVRALLSVTSRQGWASGPGLVARGGRALGRAIGGSAAGVALETAISGGFAVLFLWLFWRLLRRSTATPDADAWGGTVLLLALAAPYLLPWYAAWFIPFLALMRDRFLRAAGFAAAGLLALTGVPAEGGSAPHVWSHMVLAVHYAAAPVMLGLLGLVAWRVMRLTGPLPRRAPVPEAPTPGRT